MLLHIPRVLTEAQVARCRAILEDAKWVDGRETSGHLAARVKRNRQVDEATPEAREMGNIVVTALERTPLFMAAALPLRLFPPLFNRYEPGMAFGNHVDNAIREVAASAGRVRTDLSCTVFLAEPHEYEGGELIVHGPGAEHAVKLPAGHAVLYPGTSVHEVRPVTRGHRLASFFWIESMVRADEQRRMLYEMDMSLMKLRQAMGETAELVQLTGTYHNLLRMWADT